VSDNINVLRLSLDAAATASIREAFFVTPSMHAKRVVFLWPVPLPNGIEAEIDGDQARADSSNSPAESVNGRIGARQEARR
jgi:hypothetical protein